MRAPSLHHPHHSASLRGLSYVTSEQKGRGSKLKSTPNLETNSLEFAYKEGRRGQKNQNSCGRHIWKPPNATAVVLWCVSLRTGRRWPPDFSNLFPAMPSFLPSFPLNSELFRGGIRGEMTPKFLFSQSNAAAWHSSLPSPSPEF